MGSTSTRAAMSPGELTTSTPTPAAWSSIDRTSNVSDVAHASVFNPFAIADAASPNPMNPIFGAAYQAGQLFPDRTSSSSA